MPPDSVSGRQTTLRAWMAVGPGTMSRGVPRALEGSIWGWGSVYTQGQAPGMSLGTRDIWTKALTFVAGMTLANPPAGL